MYFRPMLWPSVATFAALAVLVALGTWQLERLSWKTALNERIAARTAQAAVALPPPGEWARLDVEALEYRPVRARGRFRHDRELHIFVHLPEARGPRRGPGYWVMTPLVLEGGGSVLVNRGFVPERFKAPQTRPGGRIEGVVAVEGLLRAPEARGPFTPEDRPGENVWFTRDVEAMAAHLGLQRSAPFFIDAFDRGLPGGLPQGGETRLSLRNPHLGYALTWFGLAIGLVGVYAAYHTARGRLGSGRRRG